MIRTKAIEHFFLNRRTNNGLEDSPENRIKYEEHVATNKAKNIADEKRLHPLLSGLFRAVNKLR